MSARKIAHVGILLLGVYLVVEACARGVSLFAGPLVIQQGADPSGWTWGALIHPAIVGLIGIALFGLIPGGLLIGKSRAWSERWFPDTGPSGELRAPTLFSIGSLLLGISFSISGLAGTVGGIAYVVAASEWDFASAWRTLAAGIVYLVAGIVLFRFSRRLASNAA